LAVLLCVSFASSALVAADNKTTRQLLSKYTDDLQSIWKDYATEKQKDTRERALQDYQRVFQRELPSAEVPTGLRVGAVIQTFIDNMQQSATLFRLDKMNTTRTAYLQACAQVFKREAAGATDYAEARNTQKVFDLLSAWLENARDTLRRTHIDAQTQTYQAINEICTNMISVATVPEGDALAQMDRNLKEARKRFPINSDALKTVNQPILSLVEQRAKDIQTKAKK